MSTIIHSHKYFIRHHLTLVVGVFLCMYFGFHVSHGQRGLAELDYAKSELVEYSEQLAKINVEKDLWESRVIALRPGSLDKDVLEERVRHVLGYKHPHEIEIISP